MNSTIFTNSSIFDEYVNYTTPDFSLHYKIFKYTVFSTSLVSLISCFFVILMYKLCPNLRNLPYRMIVYLQISDGIVAFANLLDIFDTIDHHSLCQTQAFLITYGRDASFIWTCCISTSIYCSATGIWRIVEPYERYFLILSFGLPLILSIMF